VCGLAAVLACPALGRPKTDVIVMMNGDKLTGEVKGLANSVLSVDLDYVDGTLQLDWLKVARLESSYLFRIRLQDGSTYSATIVSREALPGVAVEIEIRPIGEEPQVIDRSNVVVMTQTSDSMWQRFSGDFTLGSTYSKGNNSAQYSLSSGLDYSETRWGANLTYSSNLSSSSGATAATRNQVDFIAQRLFPWKNYFYAGTAGYLQSSVQGIERQTSLGLGLGRHLKNTNRVQFSVLAGLGWQRTNYSQSITDLRQDVAVGVISTNLQIFNFKKTRVDINASVAPALQGQGRIFAKTNATFYFKIFRKIDWNFSFYGNWDTQPPGHLQKSDYGTTFGLNYSFGSKW
jgi:putative salt-induced outer membrane protein YdiY